MQACPPVQALGRVASLLLLQYIMIQIRSTCQLTAAYGLQAW